MTKNFGASEVLLIAILVTSFYFVARAPDVIEDVQQSLKEARLADPETDEVPEEIPEPNEYVIMHRGGGGSIAYEKDSSRDECYDECLNIDMLYQPWCNNYCYHFSQSCFYNGSEYWCCYNDSYLPVDDGSWCCDPEHPNYCKGDGLCYTWPNMGSCQPEAEEYLEFYITQDGRGGDAWRFTDPDANYSNVVHMSYFDELQNDNIALVWSPVGVYNYFRWVGIQLKRCIPGQEYTVHVRSQGLSPVTWRWDYELNNSLTRNYAYLYPDPEGYTWNSWTFEFDNYDCYVAIGGHHSPSISEYAYIDEIIIYPKL